MLDATDLPDDIAALKAMLIAAQAREVRKDERIERLECQSAGNIGSDAFLMRISFILRRSTVPQAGPAWHGRTFAF
ncbi:hypothetical protein C9417_16230 [Rhizobium sp. SEMIA 4088]|nr:hypothetical protein C9417_16230 [Rhizobium sp. SEMIA 4088]